MRAVNEDRLLARVPEDPELRRTRGVLFVVCDGMGGGGRGAVASEIAVRAVSDSYFQNARDDIPTSLLSAVERAGAAIRQARETEQVAEANTPEVGTTCVAAVLQESMLYIANVGDSRAYVLHDGTLRQLTRDHSLVAQLVERGELSAAAARTHPLRSLIYRALGQPDVAADLFVQAVQPGDSILLCTDGLHGAVHEATLRATVAGRQPAESVRQLIANANAAGGPDNVAVVVVRV